MHTLVIVRWLGLFTPVSICERDVWDRSHFSASSYWVMDSFFLIDLIAKPIFIVGHFKNVSNSCRYFRTGSFYFSFLYYKTVINMKTFGKPQIFILIKYPAVMI